MISDTKRPVIMNDLEGFFTKEQRIKIYNECNNNPNDFNKLRNKVLIKLLWKSGRRITEILQIKGKHINFEKRMILWNIIKKKEPYKAWKPIDNHTLELLDFYMDEYNVGMEDYLIHWANPKKHISRQRAFQIVRKLCSKVGIKKIGDKQPHPHHFRHSMAVDLSRKLKSPSDLRKLQMFMEHSDLSVTETYLQFNDEEMRSLIDD